MGFGESLALSAAVAATVTPVGVRDLSGAGRSPPSLICRPDSPPECSGFSNRERQLNPKSGRTVLPGMFQDLRHGLRALASHPGLTIAAALSLGLAIGAQTSVYCLIDALFLRPPAGVTEAQRLVAISALDALKRGLPDEDAIRYPDYLYYRKSGSCWDQAAWPHSRTPSGRRNWIPMLSQRTISRPSVSALMWAVSFSLTRMSRPEETRSSS